MSDHEFDTETYLGCDCEQCTRLRAEDAKPKPITVTIPDVLTQFQQDESLLGKNAEALLTKMMEEGSIPYATLDFTQYEYLVTLMSVTAFERVLELMKKAAKGNSGVNVDKLIKAAHSLRAKMGRRL